MVSPPPPSAATWSLALHGGAGVVEHQNMTPEREAAFRAGLAAAIAVGGAVLTAGGPALEAVQAAVQVLEDDELFNAGRGAVFTDDGRNELDAAIMDGASLRAGAVAGLTRIRNPVALARIVLERSAHVMLVGSGAEAFAASHGFEMARPDAFFVEARWQALEQVLRTRGLPIPARPAGAPGPGDALAPAALGLQDHRYGTVGAVACDSGGHVAAATSTGGLTAKAWGRVGDSPVIGAGTYADDQACAVSGTGDGEHFIRLCVAKDIAALVQYARLDLQTAADVVIQDRLTSLGGEGGVIAVAPNGDVAWSFNTPAMFRARARHDQPPHIAIFRHEA